MILKINNSKLTCLIVFLIFLLMSQILLANITQEEYYKPKNILRFAEHLYNEGDYLRAAGEFHRYLYYYDSIPDDADFIYYKIGLCYRFASDFQKSIYYFQQTIDSFPQSIYSHESYLQIAYVFFLMGKYEKSIFLSESNFSLVKSETTRVKMKQLKGISYIYQKNWSKALDYLNTLETKPQRDSLTAQLKEFAELGKELPKKSKFLAGLMSTIIPGTGKIYANRTSDGLISLLTIGITSWQAYDGFQKNGSSSIKGWIWGTISASLYLGNIYGTIVAINIYNQQLETKLLKKVGVTINVYFQ